MAPNIVDGSLQTQEVYESPLKLVSKIKEEPKFDKLETHQVKQKGWLEFETPVKYDQAIMILVLHIVGMYGFLTHPYFSHWKTFIYTIFVGQLGAFGITGGAHRYWTHRAYKANTPMKIILAICFLTTGQNSIYQWVRDHRVHHKYSDTDADPHNINRGFFFSHCGWLMLKKHPEVIRRGNQIDMSDIDNDPITAFCNKYFVILKILVCFVIPIAIPMVCWNETLYHAFMFQMSKYIYVLNATWSVNSFAHFYGNKPYNKNIAAVENKFVSAVSFGEGWHNYHHTFPSDYRAAELGGDRMSVTTRVIDMFSKIGWTYDLQVPSKSLVKMTIERRGDGTHESNHPIEISTEGKITNLATSTDRKLI